jgi:HlyB family type I secretion system ABC transporter
MSVRFPDRLSLLSDFAILNNSEREELAGLAKSIDLKPIEVFLDFHQNLSGFIFVVSGSIELLTNTEQGQFALVNTLQDGAIHPCDIFDDKEDNLYKIRANQDGVIIQYLDKDSIRAFLNANPVVKEKVLKGRRLREILNFFLKTESLSGIPSEALATLAEEAKTQHFGAGEKAIKQGEIDDTLFFVKSGRFSVTRDEAPTVHLEDPGPGSILGEIAVLTGEPRSATVTAIEPSTVYRVPGDTFRDIVNEHEELSQRLRSLTHERLSHAEKTVKTAQIESQKKIPSKTGEGQGVAQRKKTENETIQIKKGFFGRWEKYPVIRQHSQMDCGAACLSTICKFYGKDVSINTTRDMAKVKQEGASLTNLIRALTELGFRPDAFISSMTQLREKSLPAIANWKGYHWIVVYEVTDKCVVCSDPADGLVRHSHEDFIAGWSRYTIFMEPTKKFTEFPESKAAIKSFLPFYLPFKKTILELFLLALFMQALAISAPLFSKFVIDEIILKADQQWLAAAILIMGVVTILTMVMDYISDIMALKLSLRCNFNMISHIYSRLLRLPISYFEARKIGDITNRLEQHEQVTDFITEDGLDTFLNLLTGVAFLILMFSFNIWLSLTALFFLSLNIFVVKYISPRLRQVERESFIKEAEQQSHTIESIQAAGTLKSLGAQHQSRWKYENNFAAVANLEFKEAKFSQIAEIIVTMLDSFGDVAVMFLAGYFVMQGEMTIGEMVAFQIFANGVQGPVNALIGKWDEIMEVRIAIERMNDVLEKNPEFPDVDLDTKNVDEKIELPTLLGGISFKNVTFRYEPDDQSNVLQDISLDIKPGTKVAFVGTSGCGKSTLIKLLYGFYTPSEGKILIDGFDQNEVTLTSLRRQIAIVPQKSMMMRASIQDNISIARPTATFEEIKEAAELAEADKFISKMPGGYTAMLDERGSNLSGGQKQRLSLARAFLQRASILVLDEATSALDVETERVIIENINTHFKELTVLMIAHRLSTIRNADLIVVLNKGLMLEHGNHEELMNNRGLYYSLNGLQQAAE